MILTNRALRYVRDSNAAAAASINDIWREQTNAPGLREAFIRHKRREIWARDRIGKRVMAPMRERFAEQGVGRCLDISETIC